MDAKTWKNEINHEVKPLRQNTFELNEEVGRWEKRGS